MENIEEIIKETLRRKKRNNITFLTGAGISAASGIPTYRGSDGIWIKGTKFYKPESFGTFKHYDSNQEEVWQYTFFRKKMFSEVKPNQAHYKLVEVADLLKTKFHLLTQNIDNLHQRAGSVNVYEIHGNLRKMRCASECSKEIYDIPKTITLKSQDQDLTKKELELLKCPLCGDFTRPNILWFDENYNERLFKLHSALRIAKNSSLLIILGSSGATNLPQMLVEQTLKYGGFVIDVNLEENTFTKNFKDKKQFYSFNGTALKFLELFERQLIENNKQ